MSYQNYQCDPFYYDHGSYGRGVTTWSEGTFTLERKILGSNNNNHTASFTCTVPKCYHDKDACIVTFKATPLGSNGSDIDLRFKLNNNNWGGCHISGVEGHGVQQAVDLAPDSLYHDRELNNFSIINEDSAIAVQISGFRIVRVYKMCNLEIVLSNQCGASPDYCNAGSATGNGGTLDGSRVDKPCNCDSGCGGRSFSYYHNESCQWTTLQPNDTIAWDIDWASRSVGNYIQDTICLFNFNQIYTNETSENSDVSLVASLNGHDLPAFYLSKYNRYQNGSTFPSYDLKQSPYYNEGGDNWVVLKNCGDKPVTMANDGIDVYRIYETGPPCAHLSVSCPANCSVSYGTGYYGFGTTLYEYPYTNDASLEFWHWHLDGGAEQTDIPLSIPMTSNHTLQVEYKTKPSVTVTAYDQDTGGTLTGPPAWIDYTCIGYTPTTGYASTGTHRVKVSPPWGCYAPSYIKINGNNAGAGSYDESGYWTTDNINITGATDVKFYFDYDGPLYNVQVRCWETVTYTQGYGIPIYVDWNWTPWALSPASGSLQCGTHNIGVASPIQGYYCYGATVTYASGQYYTTNFADIYIGSDTIVDFWYGY